MSDKVEYRIPALSLKSGVFRYKEKNIISHAKAKADEAVIQTPTKASLTTLYPSLDSLLDSKMDQNEDGPPTCSLLYERGTSKLFFRIPDQKLYKKTGEMKYTMLECTDVTAADLKITSKFGSWDSMSCRLLIECLHPLMAWSTISNDVTITETTSEYTTSYQTSYQGIQQESCMVKATFDLTFAKVLRDLLHDIKLAKLTERKSIQDRHKQGKDKGVKIPSKIREGLPEWVNYIPAKWYSSTIRQVIEYVLFIYTILTLLWAVWQLYKHVDFIRQYLKPILSFIEYYMAILKTWFTWLDSFTEVLTNYWWAYMKPIYLLASPAYLFLAQLFKPLRNVAGMMSMLFGPIVKSFQALASAIAAPIQMLWATVLNSSTVRFVLTRSEQLGINRAIYELTHGALDPFKAQVIVIRDLLIKSMRQIIYALKFIFGRIYFMHVFVKRERGYVNEQTLQQKQQQANEERKEKSE